jgi:hypothetical protein
MNAIPGYFLGVVCCCGLFFFGKYSITQPERVARVFAWGQTPVSFSVVFFRTLGRFFCWVAAVGVVFYLAATGFAVSTH